MLGLLLLWCCDQAVPAAVSPLASTDPPPPPFSGTVTEVIQVRGYTYTAVTPEGLDETVWIASMAGEPEVGSRVAVSPAGQADHFHSRQLDRTFDTLLFATLRPGDAP